MRTAVRPGALKPSGKPGAAGDFGSHVATLRVAFVLLPQFTLTAFAGFVDALRLAADVSDRSRQDRCQWAVLGRTDEAVRSSCGVAVLADTPLQDAGRFDCIVVVGGLLHGGQRVPAGVEVMLRQAAARSARLVGLCTGSFLLARAGLMEGYLACVSWFHRDDFEAAFPHCRVVSNQMYVVDRERWTCAGGTSVVHLAAHLIEQALGRASAVKALRILIEDQPLPSRTLQPAARPAGSADETAGAKVGDTLVRKAMLMAEQHLHAPLPVAGLCSALGIGRRQLERRFQSEVGLSPARYRHQLRLERAHWLLLHTDLEVGSVAQECGFADGTALARAVRAAGGANPLQLRQALRQAAAAGAPAAAQAQAKADPGPAKAMSQKADPMSQTAAPLRKR